MNIPIINPWLLYAADVLGVLRWVFIILGGIVLLGCIATLFAMLDMGEVSYVKNTIKGAIVGVIIVILGVCCPSKDTCYKMALAKFATPQNVEMVTEYVGDTATNVTDSVSEAIKDILDYSVDRLYDVRNNQKVGDSAE
nr:MAG TPA: hypothetical protein [Caudoviricetes sp.]